MAEPPRLCEKCCKIPFDLNVLRQTNQQRLKLPPLCALSDGQCQLCRLVKKALASEYACGFRASPWNPGSIQYLFWEYNTQNQVAGFRVQHEQWLNFGSVEDPCVDFDVLRDHLPAEIDVSRVSQWLIDCEAAHSTNCVLGPTAFHVAFPGLSVLRLIDVEQLCLVETTQVRSYVALSYVWGAVPAFKLTRSSLEAIRRPGALRRNFHRVPRTIMEAISLCQKLNCRYLWVDAICLIQNDQDDTDRGINVMDRIYERAWLVIVAASGSDAKAGLPGVVSASREYRDDVSVEVLPGVRLGHHTSLDALVKNTAYHSRAWTFQEHFLARRALYFFQDQVVFRCRGEDRFETCHDRPFTRRLEHHGPPARRELSWSSQLPTAVDMRNSLDYIEILSHYTERAMTKSEDALRALAGVSRRVSENMGCRFLQGLPTCVLDTFIIFTGESLQRRPGFPSYSWCGWCGRSKFHYPPQGLIEWLREDTWIIWYERSPSSAVRLVWDTNTDAPSLDDDTYMGYRERTPLHVDGLHHVDTTRTTPSYQHLPYQVRPYPLLQFWTLSVFLTLAETDVFKETAYLMDRECGLCGDIVLDGYSNTCFYEQEGQFELILLSRKWPNAYNVMLVQWEHGVAERRGMGTLDSSSIDKSFSPGPVWKEIILA